MSMFKLQLDFKFIICSNCFSHQVVEHFELKLTPIKVEYTYLDNNQILYLDTKNDFVFQNYRHFVDSMYCV